MSFIFFTFPSDLLYPFYWYLIYIPYLISLHSKYLLSLPYQQSQTDITLDFDILGCELSDIILLLKRDYFLISPRTDLILQEFSPIKARIPQPEPKKHQKFLSCPSLLEEFKDNLMLRRTQSQIFAPKTFYNANKSKNIEIIGILNSITDRSDQIEKEKILSFIESDDRKCQEIVDSLLRRSLNCCNRTDVINLNKVSLFFYAKSKEKFRRLFLERIQYFLEENENDSCFSGCKNTQNLIVFLMNLIAERIIRRKKVKEILMNLMLKIVDFMLIMADNRKKQEIQGKLKKKIVYIVILSRCFYQKTLTEDNLMKNCQEIMSKIDDLVPCIQKLKNKNIEKSFEVSQHFAGIFLANFDEIMNV